MARALLALALVAIGAPAAARDRADPVVNRSPNAQDVAMTPLTDLNLAKDEIPSVLLAAVDDPYASAGMTDCSTISAAIAPLDAVLGPDMDVAEGNNERISPGSIAKSVVASFIPFRSILRELSGAADHQRDFQAAIYAGAVRRGFLKGLGQQMKCDYPARPAFARVAVKKPSKIKAAPEGADTDSPSADGFVSEPVVQPLPQEGDRPKS